LLTLKRIEAEEIRAAVKLQNEFLTDRESAANKM